MKKISTALLAGSLALNVIFAGALVWRGHTVREHPPAPTTRTPETTTASVTPPADPLTAIGREFSTLSPAELQSRLQDSGLPANVVG